MAAPSVTYTFTNGTTADATQVNQNFTDLINGVSDGTKDLTVSALTMNGALNVKGNVTLGDATTDTLTVNAPLLCDPGTAAAPELSFTADTDTGIYRVGANDLGVSAGGTLRFDISSTAITSTIPHLNADGTAAAPGFSFSGDTNTGIYRIGADNLGISAGGTLRWDVSTTAITHTLPHLGADGTAAAPNYSFSGDTNTGVYRIGADNLGISAGGTLRWDTSTTAITSALPNYGAAGAASAPQYTFTSDTNTGIYSVGADDIGITTGGTLRFDISTSAITSTIPYLSADGAVGAPAFSFSGDTNTGIYRIGADNLGLAVGGAKKLEVTSSGILVNGNSTADSNLGTISSATLGSYYTGSFTWSINQGFNASQTPTVYYTKIGNHVVLTCAALTAAMGNPAGSYIGHSTTASIPSSLRPVTVNNIKWPVFVYNNAAVVTSPMGALTITTAGFIQIELDNNGSNWTNTANGGFYAWSVAYTIN